MDVLRRIRPRQSVGTSSRRLPVGDVDERNLHLRGSNGRLASALDQLRSGVPLNWGQIEDDPEMTTLARLQQAGQQCRAMPLREPSPEFKAALFEKLSTRLPAPQAKPVKAIPKSLAGFSENVPVLTQVEDELSLGVNWPLTILRGAVGLALLVLVVWGLSTLLRANSALAFSWIDVRKGGEPVGHTLRALPQDAALCLVARQDNPTRPAYFIPVQALRDAQANVDYNIPLLPNKITVPATYTFQLTQASVAPCEGSTLKPSDPAGLISLKYEGQRVPVKSSTIGKPQVIRPTIIALTMFTSHKQPAYIDVGTGDWKEVRVGDAHGIYWRGTIYHDMSGVQWNGDISVLIVERLDTVVTIVGSNSVGATEQVLTELARDISW